MIMKTPMTSRKSVSSGRSKSCTMTCRLELIQIAARLSGFRQPALIRVKNGLAPHQAGGRVGRVLARFHSVLHEPSRREERARLAHGDSVSAPTRGTYAPDPGACRAERRSSRDLIKAREAKGDAACRRPDAAQGRS